MRSGHCNCALNGIVCAATISRAWLARAATWIENRRPEAEALLSELFPHTGRALILGVTGAPGAGKSTLCDQLTIQLRAPKGRRSAMIAVDPTSPYTGGAILGDRIRMQQHHADPGVFIRSMATRGWLGGLARATTEMTMLLDAAGFDVVMVETVGVGQDEVEIARLADVTMVVLVPGHGRRRAGDQSGYHGDRRRVRHQQSRSAGRRKTGARVESYLALSHRPDGWTPPIVQTVASEGEGNRGGARGGREYRARGRDRGEREIWSGRLREMLRDAARSLPQKSFCRGREVAERLRSVFDDS